MFSEQDVFSCVILRAAMVALFLAGPAAKVVVGQGIPPELVIEPGREIKVVDLDSGEQGYYLVYIPADYRPDRHWPVVVYYHGLGGDPQTTLLQSVLRGKGFVVVGIEYYERGIGGYKYMATEDVRILHRVLDSLRKGIRIDRTRLFVAGFSRGGFYASGLLNELPDLWAGAVILGAGVRTKSANPMALAGKPIFIGCGSRDHFMKNAIEACEYYYPLGCDITFERWASGGHSVPEDNGICDWLLNYAYDGKPPTVEGASVSRSEQISDDSQSWRFDWTYAGMSVGVAFVLVGLGALYLRWGVRRPTS